MHLEKEQCLYITTTLQCELVIMKKVTQDYMIVHILQALEQVMKKIEVCIIDNEHA